eukprot:8052521-Pyramimonas_sp.AAC.1
MARVFPGENVACDEAGIKELRSPVCFSELAVGGGPSSHAYPHSLSRHPPWGLLQGARSVNPISKHIGPSLHAMCRPNGIAVRAE